MKTLEFVAVEPQGDVKALVIWLHGLGDSGHGFAPIVPELRMDPELGIKFIFPHAPVQPVTINGGMAMNSWYDIKSLTAEDRADEAGVIESAAMVEALLEQQLAAGIPSHKIVLAGFSQGGVITYHLSTRVKHRLAGIMGLSTYMCKPQKLSEQKVDANLETPIFAAHGSHDPVVPMAAGLQAKQALLDNGFDVQWSDYPMEHSVCAQQVADIAKWLAKVLA